jgi:hypothetical protein
VARNITVTNLILRVREATDQVNSTFVSDAEIQRFLDMSYGEMWERVHQAGIPIGEVEQIHSGNGVTVDWTPSTAWLSTMWVAIKEGSTYRRLPRMDHEQEINWLSYSSGYPLGYRVAELTLRVLPATPTGQSVYHHYIKQHTAIDGASGSTSINCITPTGERIVVMGAALEIRKKKEDAYSSLMAEREGLYEKFMNQMMHMYMGDNRSPTVVGPLGMADDMGSNGSDWWWYRGGW